MTSTPTPEERLEAAREEGRRVLRDNPRIAIYARITRDEMGYAVGVADQSVRSRELAARQWPGAEIVSPGCTCKKCQEFAVPPDVYCDNDLTASGKDDRPHYQRLLDDIKAGRVDLVVAAHNDRLHRNPVELEEYINICQPREVPTHYVKAGTYDLTTASGRMVARMLGAMARAEWERMVERQQAAKRRNRDAGIRQAGAAPFGYRLDVRDERGHQIPGISKGLAVVEAEAAAVTQAYADVLAGVTPGTIARRWNKAGFRGHRQQGLWNQVQVRRALLNPANAGFIEHQGKVVRRAAWEPIVGEDTYKAARALLTDPARRTSPGPKPAHLLTGVLICGVCEGRRFTVKASSRRVPAYMCNSMGARPGAAGSGWHLSRNKALLDEYIEGIIIKRLGRRDVVAALNTRPETDIPALDARRTAINAELRGIAAARFTWQQKEIQSAPLLDELERIDKQVSEALHGSQLPEIAGGEDPGAVWAALKDAGNIERMRAIAALLLRARLLPARRPASRARGPKGMLDYDAVQILPPDA